MSFELRLPFQAGGLCVAVALLGWSHSCAFSITGWWASWSGGGGPSEWGDFCPRGLASLTLFSALA